jgi:hypothetical protein
MPVEYSGTPLARKLGLKPGLRVFAHGMPPSVFAEIKAEMPDIRFQRLPRAPLDVAHVFVTTAAELADWLTRLLPQLAPAGALWVSWPKRASKVATDVTEDRIRELALPLGLVDVKVCAIDQTWSGLKLVVRREARRMPAEGL